MLFNPIIRRAGRWCGVLLCLGGLPVRSAMPIELDPLGERVYIQHPATGKPVAALGAPRLHTGAQAPINRSLNRHDYDERSVRMHLAAVTENAGILELRWRGHESFEAVARLVPNAVSGRVEIQTAVHYHPSAGESSGPLHIVAADWPLHMMEGSINVATAFPFKGRRCLPSQVPEPSNWRAHWGTHAFQPTPVDQYMYLPLASFSSDNETFLNVMIEPRSAFTVQATNDTVLLSRLYFLKPAPGFSDASIDLRDGNPPAAHAFTLWAADKGDATWEALYWDGLLRHFPEMMATDNDALPAQVLLGSLTAGSFTFSPRWLRRLYSFGLRLGGLNHKLHLTDSYRAALSEGITPAQQSAAGIKPTLSLNRFASDPEREQRYGIPQGAQYPGLVWTNVQDALLYTPDGEPRRSWNGYGVTLNPELSFGRRTLERVDQLLLRHGFAGVTVDYYYDGAGADFHRSLDHFPFEPQTASDGAFLRALAERVRQSSGFLVLNGLAPPLLMAQNYFDLASIDCPPEMAMQFKMQAVHKPFVYLGDTPYPEHAFTTEGWLRRGFKGMLYGGAIAPWSFNSSGADRVVSNLHFIDDSLKGRFLFARNAYLGSRLARAAPCGGELGRDTWMAYRHPSGSVYVVGFNGEDSARKVDFTLSARWTQLDPERPYNLILWDPESGGEVVARNVKGNELTAKSLFMKIPSHRVRLLCIEPALDALVHDYFAQPDPEMVVLRAATDRIKDARMMADGDAMYPKFTMDGRDGVLFEMVFELPEKWMTPPSISVDGAAEYSVLLEGRAVRLRGIQRGAVTVRFHPGAGGERLLRCGERVHYPCRPDDWLQQAMPTLATNAWRTITGRWLTAVDELRATATGDQRAAIALEKRWQGDYEIQFESELSLDRDNPRPPRLKWRLGFQDGEEVVFVCNQTQRDSVYIKTGDTLTKKGLATALHPNVHTQIPKRYFWRIRRQQDQVEIALAWDDGSVFEPLITLQVTSDFMPAFGAQIESATLSVRAFSLWAPYSTSQTSTHDQ